MTVTVKDVFGDAFNGTIEDGDIDSIMVYFLYRKADEVDATLTSMLQAGGQITANPVRTRVPSRFYGDNWASKTSAPYGNRLNSGTAVGGDIAIAATTYLGTTSHSNPEEDVVPDSIYVVAYAANSPTVRDSVLIGVEPSPPIAFDVDTFKGNLAAAIAAGQVVQGAQIPVDLPIFALDTAFNRVSNMTLDKATSYLDNITVSGTGIKAFSLLIDGRDPVGYWSLTTTDSIRIDNVGTRTGIGETQFGLASDSSFIYDFTEWDRTDSSRINFGAIGPDSLGLRLNYVGTNYRLSIKWDPAALGGYNGAVRTQDLGLFTLLPQSATDSVETISATGAKAGSVTSIVVNFTAPAGNSVGPNLSPDSVIYISFVNLPAGAGLGTHNSNGIDDSVSVDGLN
jgi:hypothetical protein